MNMAAYDLADDFPEWGLHDSHVWVRKWIEMGCDLMLAGILTPEIAPCGACEVLGVNGLPPSETIVDTDHNGTRWYHTVKCGSCGTSGPWGRTESEALAKWAKVWQPKGGRS